MAFGSFEQGGNHQAPMSEINTTPLVDVMLVLLIIFIITAPLLSHAVKVDLPKASSQAADIKPQTVTVSIKADGSIHWNQEKISLQDFEQKAAQAVSSAPGSEGPELHLRADKDTRYEVVAQVMSISRRAGIQKIGFMTDPGPQ